VDSANPVAKIVIGDQEFILREKEWSGWKTVKFDLIPTQSVSGTCMFYLKEVRPDFKLYVSAINIDPAHPVLPISTPPGYAEELAARFGTFFTKGLPADTSALGHGILDEQEFLEQDDVVLRESERIFEYEFSRFDSGLLFYYVSSTDQRQHMFWRLQDEHHPMFDAGLASRFGGRSRISIGVRPFLDGVLRRIDEDTILLVMSDHGFNSFRRQFNLNTWLYENGYHRLRNPFKQEDSGFSRTRTGRGHRPTGSASTASTSTSAAAKRRPGRPRRERTPHPRDRRRLEATVDPKTGEKAILRAYIAREVYRGPHLETPRTSSAVSTGATGSPGARPGQAAQGRLRRQHRKMERRHMGRPRSCRDLAATGRSRPRAGPV